MSSNDIRISFAEWLFRMTECGLPYQARTLAIYAAVFKISNNNELGALAGMANESGTADRTYDKWKKRLLDDGWVIIQSRKGGRGVGVDVTPAYKETPVTFTDVIPRDQRRFYPRNKEERGAEKTPVSHETPAGNTPVSKERSPHTPLKENNNPISSVASGATALTHKQLEEKLLEACNGALANPAIAPGLLNLSTPNRWLEGGADLERDVLPTLREVAHRRRGRAISTWEYFTNAVVEAVAKRLAGLPRMSAHPRSEVDRQAENKRKLNAI